MKGHCSQWNCDLPPTVILRWRDEENRPCFAKYCAKHGEQAHEDFYREGKAPTLQSFLENH